jgi:ubiquinone/menaquinone biosynthesis C-methylase UbiE
MEQTEAKEQLSKEFDDCSDYYATERERTPYFQAQLDIALSMLAGKKGRILDIGCAAGAEIRELLARKFEVVGMDLSPRMLNFARRRFAGESAAQFCLADVEHLPFATQSMDHVVCLGVFEYLKDYSPALAEVHRVMRPGGDVVFAIPSYISVYSLTERIVRWTVVPMKGLVKRVLFGQQRQPDPGPPNRCVPRSFRALLREHGFQPNGERYSNFFIYPLDRFPDLNIRVAAALEPLCSIPVLRSAAFVYLVAARKQ